MRLRHFALAGLALVAAPALAQDDGTVNWDGFYVGGHFGGAFQPSEKDDTLVFSRGGGGFSPALTTTTGANAFSPGFCNGGLSGTGNGNCINDRDKYEYGVRVGLDRHYGPFVVGIVGEVGRNESVDFTSAFSTTPAGYTLARDLRYNANFRGRIGVAPGRGDGLFYLTGGAAYGRVRDRFYTTNTANAFDTSGRHHAYGYVAGGGAEVMVLPQVSFGLEYLYTSYGDKRSRVLVSQGSAAATNPFVLGGTTTVIAPTRTNLNYHNIRVTAAFHF